MIAKNGLDDLKIHSKLPNYKNEWIEMEVPSLKLPGRTWTLMAGRWSFLFGIAYFQGRVVCFRRCKIRPTGWIQFWDFLFLLFGDLGRVGYDCLTFGWFGMCLNCTLLDGSYEIVFLSCASFWISLRTLRIHTCWLKFAVNVGKCSIHEAYDGFCLVRYGAKIDDYLLCQNL